MKYFTLIIVNLITYSAFSQSIVCNSSGCVPTSLQAVVQEKVTHSAIDLNFNVEPLIEIQTGTSSSTKDLRINMNNGEFPGKSLNIDLSSNLDNKNSGNMMLFADNIDTLNVKLNGYNGSAGVDASQLCAQRILSSQYGEDVRVRFLQRRGNQGSGLTNDRCAQVDIDDITTNKFTCNDPAYTVLDSVDPKINFTRVRKIARCQSILPQNLCVQKTYNVTCNMALQFTTKYTQGSGGAPVDSPQDFLSLFSSIKRSSCSFSNSCPSFGPCYDRVQIYKNGSLNQDIYHNFTNTGVGYSSFLSTASNSLYVNKTYRLTKERLNYYSAIAGSKDVCDAIIEEDAQYSQEINKFSVTLINQTRTGYRECGAFGSNCSDGCYYDNRNQRIIVSNNISDLKWVARTRAVVQETSPGFDTTGQRLAGSSVTPFLISPNGGGAYRQTNEAEWQLELMPAFTQSCNANFDLVNIETSNVVKSIYDPNLFNNNSAYCIDRNNPSNCSINPPLCDNPESSVNCKKTSICEQINHKYCLDDSNPVNCSSPPFCDNENDPTNCSTVQKSKSCDPNDPLNSFCEKDPNNLGQYLFIGTEPDPFKNTESFECRENNCLAESKTVEQSLNLDILTPTSGKNGTIPGQGLFFVYDIRSMTQQSIPGQAGVGGQSDITSASQIRYCATKRDFTTDPNTRYENDPEITFRRVQWKAFDIKAGGQPGQFPPFTDKKVETFKKLDPSIRYLLKKELL